MRMLFTKTAEDFIIDICVICATCQLHCLIFMERFLPRIYINSIALLCNHRKQYSFIM